jgi:hypothetical protein
VANYVETEQILQLNDVACSYVQVNKIHFFFIFNKRIFIIQIRGSVPCYWTQLPNLRYKPKVIVLSSNNHVRKSFKKLKKNKNFI